MQTTQKPSLPPKPTLADAILKLDKEKPIDDQLKAFKKLTSFADGPQVCDQLGRTPLMCAIITMNYEAIQWLFRLAEPNKDLGWDVRDKKENKTAVMHAFDCSSYSDKKNDLIDERRVQIATFILERIQINYKLSFEQTMRYCNEAMEFVAKTKLKFAFNDYYMKEKANDPLVITFLQNAFSQGLKYSNFELAKNAFSYFGYAKQGTFINPQNADAICIAINGMSFPLAYNLIQAGFPIQSEQYGSALTCFLTLINQNNLPREYKLAKMSERELKPNTIEYDRDRDPEGVKHLYRVLGLDNRVITTHLEFGKTQANFRNWDQRTILCNPGQVLPQMLEYTFQAGHTFSISDCFKICNALRAREVKLSKSDLQLILKVGNINLRRGLFSDFNLIQHPVNEIFDLWKEVGNQHYCDLVYSIPSEVDCTKYLRFAIEQFIAGIDQQDMLKAAKILNDVNCDLEFPLLAATSKDLTMLRIILEIRVKNNQEEKESYSPFSSEPVWQILNPILKNCLDIKEEQPRQAFLQDAYQVFKKLKTLSECVITKQDWELAIQIGSEELFYNLFQYCNWEQHSAFFNIIIRRNDPNFVAWSIHSISKGNSDFYLRYAFEAENFVAFKQLLATDCAFSGYDPLPLLDFHQKNKDKLPLADLLEILVALRKKKFVFRSDMFLKAVEIENDEIVDQIILSMKEQNKLQELLTHVIANRFPLPVIQHLIAKGAQIESRHWQAVIQRDDKEVPWLDTLLKNSPGLKDQTVLNYAVGAMDIIAVKKLLQHAPWTPGEVETAKRVLWQQECKEFSEDRTRITRILKFYPWQLTESDFMAGSEFNKMPQEDRDFILSLKGNTTAVVDDADKQTASKIKDVQVQELPNTAPPSAPPAEIGEEKQLNTVPSAPPKPIEYEQQQEGVPNVASPSKNEVPQEGVPNLVALAINKQSDAKVSQVNAAMFFDPDKIRKLGLLHAQINLMQVFMQEFPSSTQLFEQMQAFCNQELQVVQGGNNVKVQSGSGNKTVQ